MNKKVWMQHISHTGPKYEFIDFITLDMMRVMNEKGLVFTLPSDQYKLCAAPKRWVNVTEKIFDINAAGDMLCKTTNGCRVNVMFVSPDYHFSFENGGLVIKELQEVTS
jgi:hypothetical protein